LAHSLLIHLKQNESFGWRQNKYLGWRNKMNSFSLKILVFLGCMVPALALAIPRGKPQVVRSSASLAVERSHRLAGYQAANVSVSLPTMSLMVTKVFHDSYYPQAAHPNFFWSASNKDLYSGKELRLKDLFKKGSGYAQTIRKFARKAIAQELGEDLNSGFIGQNIGSSKHWQFAISKQGIELLPNSFPHAVGPITVTVPWSVVADKVDSMSPVYTFARTAMRKAKAAAK